LLLPLFRLNQILKRQTSRFHYGSKMTTQFTHTAAYTDVKIRNTMAHDICADQQLLQLQDLRMTPTNDNTIDGMTITARNCYTF
jgi:hypothetical protein